jgi:hypothetical protein
MTCRKWATLSDAEKGQLISIWIVAADKDGVIPSDPIVLRKVCQLDANPDIEKFVTLQLLERVGCHVVVTATPPCCQPDAPEKRREEERREDLPAKAGLADMDLFETFYKSYPKKKNRGQAEKAWCRIKPNSDLVDKMMESLAVAKRSTDWTKDGGKYIPYPATWLNAKGWEDEAGQSAEIPWHLQPGWS